MVSGVATIIRTISVPFSTPAAAGSSPPIIFVASSSGGLGRDQSLSRKPIRLRLVDASRINTPPRAESTMADGRFVAR